jgi:hypothetical protein
MAGYSGTPLAKKLGYKPGLTVHLHHAPADYHRLLALDAKEPVTWCDEPVRGIQLVHAFTSPKTASARPHCRWGSSISRSAPWMKPGPG